MVRTGRRLVAAAVLWSCLLLLPATTALADDPTGTTTTGGDRTLTWLALGGAAVVALLAGTIVLFVRDPHPPTSPRRSVSVPRRTSVPAPLQWDAAPAPTPAPVPKPEAVSEPAPYRPRRSAPEPEPARTPATLEDWFVAEQLTDETDARPVRPARLREASADPLLADQTPERVLPRRARVD
ncbi:hypothetical protein ACQBAU_04065 [Propionibacteriaceae bacterium Y2011]